MCSSTSLIIIGGTIVHCLHTIFPKTEPLSIAAHVFFAEMFVKSFLQATSETHLGNQLPADHPFETGILLAAMCRNL